jgi:hypothetical protein
MYYQVINNKFMSKEISIVEMRKEIQTEVIGKREVFVALAQNTFKGLEQENIPKALLEGMMRGYSIKDFMTKKIYATPFWNGKEQKQDYALVQSIADVRAIAMKGGQSGKSAPSFVEDKDGNVISCSVTIWKKDGDDRGYTATVYFDEYEKPAFKKKDGTEVPGMWQTKKRTMIAKVAEMHALRMAFPEELSDAYIEEEFDRESVVHIDADVDVIPSEEKQKAIDTFKPTKTIDELKDAFKALSPELRKDDDIVEAYKAQKAIIDDAKKTEKKK